MSPARATTAPLGRWRSRSRLVDEVAQELRERIYAGHYRLGAKLPQSELADALNVSRTPLREAFRILESEGLLASEPGKGVRVASADASTLKAAYQVREVIDGLAARLAAGTTGARAQAALARVVDDQAAHLAAGDLDACVRDDGRFHTNIIELSGNRYLDAQLPIVWMTTQGFRPLGIVSPAGARRAIEQHRAILAAIAGGDARAAELAARRHIRTTADRILAAGTEPRSKELARDALSPGRQ